MIGRMRRGLYRSPSFVLSGAVSRQSTTIGCQILNKMTALGMPDGYTAG